MGDEVLGPLTADETACLRAAMDALTAATGALEVFKLNSSGPVVREVRDVTMGDLQGEIAQIKRQIADIPKVEPDYVAHHEKAVAEAAEGGGYGVAVSAF